MRNEKYKELFEKYKELSEDYLSLQRMVKLILLTRERKKYGYSEPLFFDDHCKMFLYIARNRSKTDSGY